MSDQDPSQLRISDAERDQVAELLREAAGEGRIDLAELDERLEAAYAAKTYADLVPITLDCRPREAWSIARPPRRSPDGPAVRSSCPVPSPLVTSPSWAASSGRATGWCRVG